MRFMIKLVHLCRKCGKTNYISIFHHDRYALSEKLGTEFKSECRYCGVEATTLVNNVYARIIPIYGMIVFGLLLLLVCYFCYFLWNEYWRDSVLVQNNSIQISFIGSCIPIVIMAVLSISLREKIMTFNKYKI